MERKDQKQSHQSIQPPPGMAQEFWVLGKEGMCFPPSAPCQTFCMMTLLIFLWIWGLIDFEVWAWHPQLYARTWNDQSYQHFLKPHEWTGLVMRAQNSRLAPNHHNSATSTLQAIWWPFLVCLMLDMPWASAWGQATASWNTVPLICFSAWRIHSASNSSTGFPTWNPDLQRH